jgi:hypothetical protein
VYTSSRRHHQQTPENSSIEQQKPTFVAFDSRSQKTKADTSQHERTLSIFYCIIEVKRERERVKSCIVGTTHFLTIVLLFRLVNKDINEEDVIDQT